MTKRYGYRIKCERCGVFVDKKDISFNYGRKTCHKCLRVQVVGRTYLLYIPSFVIKEAGINPYEEVIISNDEEGVIIIRKLKKK